MQKISFSFGRNWNRYVRTVDDAKIAGAVEDIRARLGTGVRGKRVIDVGCGSGIHSLAFHRLGASRVVSFDADPHSVTATTTLWERENRPSSWEIRPGSILDPRMIASLGQFDVVYSWGVLHHTGAMWQGIENAAKLVAVDGTMWIALYVAGPHYERDLAVKRSFNAAADPVKWAIVAREVLRVMYGNALQHKNPLAWNRQKERGMSVYYDIWDWLGGLPYEVASREEVDEFLIARGFESEGFEGAGEGGCANYIYRRRA
jgi:2-polyprenyl-6-hydroxyphenyl methylase/3-demethylubiquinone-9 3-methyltransferase